MVFRWAEVLQGLNRLRKKGEYRAKGPKKRPSVAKATLILLALCGD